MYMLFYKLVHMSSACFLWPCWPGIWGWAVGNIWCVCCIVMEFFSKGKQNWFSSIYFFLNQSWIFTFSIVWTARRAQSESGSLSSFCVTGQLFFILSDYLHISVCSHRPLIDHICLHPGIRLFFFFFFMLQWAGTTVHQFIQKSKWCALLSAKPAA